MRYQKEQGELKSVDNLSHDHGDWTMSDLHVIELIVEERSKSVEKVLRKVPSMDDSIQELEKSLKKSIVN